MMIKFVINHWQLVCVRSAPSAGFPLGGATILAASIVVVDLERASLRKRLPIRYRACLAR